MIAPSQLQVALAQAMAADTELLAWCAALPGGARDLEIWVNGDPRQPMSADQWPVVGIFPAGAVLGLASRTWEWTLQIRWWVLDEQRSEETPADHVRVKTFQAGVLLDQLGQHLLRIATGFADRIVATQATRSYDLDVNGPDFPIIDGTLHVTFVLDRTFGTVDPEMPA